MIKGLVYIAVVIAFFDMFTQLPIITPYARSLGGTPIMLGMAVGIYSFTNMFGNILAGRAIDQVGAKKILVTGLALTSIVLLFYTLVNTAGQLVTVRFIHGLCAGLLAPGAFTLMSGFIPSGRQGKTMAQSGAAVGMAAILGPAFSGIVGAKLGIEWIFLSVSALMALSAVVLGVLLPSGRKEGEKGPFPSESAQGGIRELISIPPVIDSYIGSFSLMFALGILAYMLPLQVETLGLGPAASGLMLSTFGIVAILFFLLPTNRVFDRIDPQKVMLCGMMVVVISLFLLYLFKDRLLMFIAMGIFGLGFALMFPAMNTIILKHVKAVHRGKAFGFFYALFSIGVIAGSLLVGWVEATPDLAFLIGALFILAMNGLTGIRYTLRVKG